MKLTYEVIVRDIGGLWGWVSVQAESREEAETKAREHLRRMVEDDETSLDLASLELEVA